MPSDGPKRSAGLVLFETQHARLEELQIAHRGDWSDGLPTKSTVAREAVVPLGLVAAEFAAEQDLAFGRPQDREMWLRGVLQFAAREGYFDGAGADAGDADETAGDG